ncbi:ThuA domain-containing protein [Hyunsoonleella sp. SJ7]|uniref:ThuA domain-containing protein n=1 Tax=Hyunsoonleella aquatilis TaxID=2762758 RepID=A0A923KLL3_9FLAO|nr:ThuA domain-containing protein [Hyunsoonleella aquatilis]MBC3758045.1 ThuA domain-containing protein [Hyunsoonleella aquatilis]
MKRFAVFIFLSLFLVHFNSANGQEKSQPLVYVFSKTTGFRHTSIEPGIESIKKLGSTNSFRVKATEDADELISNLKKIDAVVFLSPSGDILNDKQQKKFEKFIKKGGGFVGIHAATVAETNWQWYNSLVGAQFNGHPKEKQNAALSVLDKTHQSVAFLDGENWIKFDEWYNFKNMNSNVKVILTVDEDSYRGGKHGKFHPIAWHHETLGGRAFYTALGHTNESYSEPLFLQHILGGILYAIGE